MFNIKKNKVRILTAICIFSAILPSALYNTTYGNNYNSLYMDFVADDTSEVKYDSGRYVGQIDSNSIEVKISGIPDELSARAFRLTDDIKNEFYSLDLQKDEVIKLKYKVNEFNQNILLKIERINR